MTHDSTTSNRRLIALLLDGEIPSGTDFDVCREIIRREPDGSASFQALCMLLEGALADARLDIEDTQVVVGLLKALARSEIRVEELVP